MPLTRVHLKGGKHRDYPAQSGSQWWYVKTSPGWVTATLMDYSGDGVGRTLATELFPASRVVRIEYEYQDRAATPTKDATTMRAKPRTALEVVQLERDLCAMTVERDRAQKARDSAMADLATSKSETRSVRDALRAEESARSRVETNLAMRQSSKAEARVQWLSILVVALALGLSATAASIIAWSRRPAPTFSISTAGTTVPLDHAAWRHWRLNGNQVIEAHHITTSLPGYFGTPDFNVEARDQDGNVIAIYSHTTKLEELKP
jgi:hypothetical protein